MSESLFDALVAVVKDDAAARTWMTPTLVAAWPTGAIPAIQWDGLKFISQAHAQASGKRTWSITGKGVVAELKRAIQRNDEDVIDLLARGIGKPVERKDAA